MTEIQRRVYLVCIAAIAAASCATTEEEPPAAATDQTAKWAGNGWLSPGKDGEPEIIGLYFTREECEAAVADWISRQVAANPVSSECLPIDRR